VGIVHAEFQPLALMAWGEGEGEEEMTDGRTDKGHHAISLTSTFGRDYANVYQLL